MLWQENGRGPFSHMRAAFITAQKPKRDAYWDVLEAGGASVVRCENFRNAVRKKTAVSSDLFFFSTTCLCVSQCIGFAVEFFSMTLKRQSHEIFDLQFFS
jgi:hypothetical protein